MKVNKFLLSFALVLCLIGTSLSFAGCGKSYTYAELRESYISMVETYPDFFDDENFVDITYNTQNLNNAINNGNKSYNFTKLSNDLSNTEAVYEPVLRASLMMASTFLIPSNDIGTSIPADKLNEAYQSLEELKTCFHNLNEYKTSLLEFFTMQSFDQADSVIQIHLKNYCEELYNTIQVSCDFSELFEQIYANYIFNDESIVRPGALVTGSVRFEYLTKITEFARIYQQFQLSLIHNQILDGPQDASKPIELNETSICSQLLLQYEEIKNCKMEGTINESISNQEQNIINAYNNLNKYNDIYYSNYRNALNAVSKYDMETLTLQSSDVQLTTEQQACIDKINEFLNTDCNNILNYMNTIQEYVLIYNGVI